MRIHRKLLTVLLFASVAVPFTVLSVWAAPVRPVHAQHAMIASVHELASKAGVEVMQSGGNAVDAAVAVGFVLAVVHSQAGKLGGGGVLLIRTAGWPTKLLRS